VDEYQHEYGVPVIEIAAALGVLAQGKKPLLAVAAPTAKRKPRDNTDERKRADRKPEREQDAQRKTAARKPKPDREHKSERQPKREKGRPDAGLERFRIEVGLAHGVKPGNIVGAIANEAEIESEYIGRIEIFDDYSTVDLPEGMPKELFKHLKSVWVSGQRLQISRPPKGAARGKPSTVSTGGSKKPGERPPAKLGVRRRPAK